MTQEPKIIKAWHNFSQNDGSSCVDVQFLEGGFVQLRDSKNIEAGHFTFDAAEWNAFLTGAKAGRADHPSA